MPWTRTRTRRPAVPSCRRPPRRSSHRAPTNRTSPGPRASRSRRRRVDDRFRVTSMHAIRVESGSKVSLDDISTRPPKSFDRDEANKELAEIEEELGELQELMW